MHSNKNIIKNHGVFLGTEGIFIIYNHNLISI